MAITTFPKTAFNDYLETSILDYFNNLADTNYLSEVFKTIYVAIRPSDIKYIKDLLVSKKAVIILERATNSREEQTNDAFVSEQTSTTRTFANGYAYYFDLKLRVICKSNEVDGRRDLLDCESFMRKMFEEDGSITLKNYYRGTATTPTNTSVKLRYRYFDIEFTELPVGFTDYQEGVFTIPCWVDMYELNTYDRVTAHKETYTNKKA